VRVGAAVREGDELGEGVGAFGAAEEGGVAGLGAVDVDVEVGGGDAGGVEEGADGGGEGHCWLWLWLWLDLLMVVLGRVVLRGLWDRTAFSVCRKVSNPWHRNCRAPP